MNYFFSDSITGITYLIRHGKWVILGRSFALSCNLLLSIILARTLGQEIFGKYQYILSILLIMNLFSLANLNQAIIKYVSRGFAFIYLDLLKFRLKFSFIGICALLLISAYFFLKDKYIAISLLILAFAYPFYYSLNLYEGYLQSKLEYKKLNIFSGIKSFLLFLVMSVGVYITKNLVFLTALFATVHSLCNIYFSKVSFDSKKNDQTHYDANVKNKALKLGLILSGVNVFLYALEGFDRFLIGTFIDLKSLAVFSIGVIFARQVQMLFKSIIGTIDPKLSTIQLQLRHFLLLLAFGTLGGFCLAAIAPYIIVFLYSSEYSQSIFYAQLILCFLGFYLGLCVLQNQFLYYGVEREKIIYIFNIINPSIQIIYLIIVINLNISPSMKLIFIAWMYALRSIFSLLILIVLDFFLVKQKLFEFNTN